jgi:hypothetical protein
MNFKNNTASYWLQPLRVNIFKENNSHFVYFQEIENFCFSQT